MEWLLVLLGLSVLMSLVLMSYLCLDCYRGPMVSISQTHTSEDTYIPSTQFSLIRPIPSLSDQSYVHPSNSHLSPLSLVDPQRRACPSFTPTETESNNSSENPGGSYVNTESDLDDPGYIIVLPEDGPPPTNQSRASTPSSDSQHDYENIEKAKVILQDDSDDYLNVEQLPQGLVSGPDLDSSESDSEDEGNYVNQPGMVHHEPSA